MYLQDFLSFLNQKKTPLALEKMFLRKMKCMKSEFNLGSAPSLAPVFQKLLFDGPTNCKGTEKGVYAPRVRASTGHFVVKYCKSQGWIQTSQWKYSHQVHWDWMVTNTNPLQYISVNQGRQIFSLAPEIYAF